MGEGARDRAERSRRHGAPRSRSSDRRPAQSRRLREVGAGPAPTSHLPVQPFGTDDDSHRISPQPLGRRRADPAARVEQARRRSSSSGFSTDYPQPMSAPPEANCSVTWVKQLIQRICIGGAGRRRSRVPEGTSSSLISGRRPALATPGTPRRCGAARAAPGRLG